MDSSPISSRQELNQFHAHHVFNYQAHPKPLLDLLLQAQTPHHMHIHPILRKKYPNHTHKHIQTWKNRINSLKPGTLAQAKPTASLKLVHLAWASSKQWLHHVVSLRRDSLAWASHTFAQNNTQTSPRRVFDKNITPALRELA